MLIAIGMHAAETALCISLTGGETKVFLLSDKPVVTMGVATVDIKSDDACASIERGSVAKMTFIDASSVDKVADAEIFSYVGNEISAPGLHIEVYSLAGVKVASGVDTLSVEQLAAGTYVVKAGKTSVKILKK